jgi:hypothetical protein
MRWRTFTLVGCVALIALGCSGSTDRSNKTAAPAAGGAVSAGPQLQTVAAVQPKVIYTAQLTVRVAAVEAAANRAGDIARGAGGSVFAQTSELEGAPEATLTIKVPPDRFEATVHDLGALGRTLQRQTKGQDVTADVVDLEGRLKTAEASADRLRSLLGASKATPDIVALEAELAKRESDIESMQGRLRVITSQVDEATIELKLTESAPAVKVNDDLPGFVGSFKTGAVVLGNIGLGLLAFLGFLLPFTPILAGAFFGTRVLVRRNRRKHPQQRPNPPAWTPPPRPPGA